jgi:uncharacterized protein YegJ (DUF2314 family)
MHAVKRLKALLLLCLIFAAACAPKPAVDPLSVAPGSTDDPEFNEAVRRAQTSLDQFRRGLLSPSPTASFIGLRVRFEGPNEGALEYHWTRVVDYFDNTYTVELLDSVSVDMGLHAGRQVAVPLTDVIDWIIVEEDGTFTGGYTVLLAYDRMTPGEKEKFLAATGYVIK